MLQIRTTINGENKFLDLYQNEPVFLSLSFAELQDITKKNSAFSKGFSLPGSKLNNQIFNFFYDLNAIPTDFNPNNKFEAVLMWDGYEIFQGHIRLDGVTIANGGEIIYQVTFYNQVGDLMANIGDKYLFNTNLSGLTHPFSQEVILKSLYDPTLFPLTGATDYSYENGETMWGLYNIGYEYVSGNTVNDEISPLIQFTPILSADTQPQWYPLPPNFDYVGSPARNFYFKPTIQIKTLYESIVNDAGYEIESEFFNTDYFKHYYMPLKFLDETVYAKNSIVSCYKYGPQNFQLTNFSTRVDTVPNSGVTCNTLGYSLSATTFTVPAEFAGVYTYRFTMNLVGTCIYQSFNIPTVELAIDDGTSQTTFYSTQWCDDGQVNTVSFDQSFNFTGQSQVSFYFRGEYADVSGFTAEIINGPRFLPSGTTINYAEEFPSNDYKQIDFITSINKYFNLVVVPNPDKPRSLIIEPIIDYIGKGSVLDWTTKIDFNQPQSLYPTNALINGTLFYDFKLDQDYANQDFKGQTNRTFGTDRFKLNQEYKDAETKFDYMFSSPIDITINNSWVPLLTVSSMSKLKSVDVAGQPQQTFVPFKVLPKLIFKGPTLPTDNWGFVGGAEIVTGSSLCTSGITYTTNADGVGRPLEYIDCFGNQYFYYGSVNGSNTLPFCANPNSLRFVGPLFPFPSFTLTFSGNPCNTVNTNYQSWWMDDFQISVFNNLNRFTTYPFNYNNFSHYCNFRGEDKTNITPSEYSFVAPDLYDIYYKPYIDDLISEENKIYKAKIYLYPQDIQGLRWNEKVLVNNTYFRINQISNFNALEPGVCDIELVKLTKDYEPHRVLYYDLIPCAGGPELHSNSDIMYHLYAYAGRYVRLYDNSLNYLGCYNVEVSAFNENYTYEHYYLSSGYTDIELVNVYPDCGCVGRTDMNLVQEEPGEVRYFNYIGYECDGSDVYNFNSTSANLEDTGLVYKLFSSGLTQNVCVTGVTPTYLQTVSWTEVGSFSSCTACNFVPPTPTPTPTVTTTITPTITPTPTKTPVTPTPTPTFGATPTPSVTPTITPSAGGGGNLNIYARYSNIPQQLRYTLNGGSYIDLGTVTTTSCDYKTTITGLTPGDTFIFTTTTDCALGGDTGGCPNISSCSVTYVWNGFDINFYITVDGSLCC